MRTLHHFTRPLAALASAVLSTLFLVSCQQPQQSQAPTAVPTADQSKAAVAATHTVYVQFEGPWAIAPDPKDPNSILLLAPKTKTHSDLYVAASNHSTIASGTYDLSFPAHGTGAGTYDPSFLRAKIDPANVQRVLDDKSSHRYSVRLPKPEAYIPATRHRSRAGSTYPPDVSTEMEYATGASLRYSVESLTGFSLSGTPDSGTFNPLLLQVDTPTIRFAIEPTQSDDNCNTHSRQTFHDLVQLVGVSLYVDFPENPTSCHDKDPQRPRAGKTASAAPFVERLTALLSGNMADVQEAGLVAGESHSDYLRILSADRGSRSVTQRMLAAYYFLFGVQSGGCRSPILGG